MANVAFVSRGTMRTYGGRCVRSFAPGERRVRYSMDEHGFLKEQIIEPNGQLRPPPPKPPTAPSSPTTTVSHRVFSDAEQPTSASPPSSPPFHRTSSPTKPSSTSFRSLKRKRSSYVTEEPLGELSDHGNGARKKPARGSKRTRLTQMQLDLGGTTRRTCRECGMEYVPSNREDEKLHKEFHGLNASGVDLGVGFAKDSQVVESFGWREVVSMIDARSSSSLRKRVKRVLDVVRSDLGAVDIDQETLWGANGAQTPRGSRDEQEQGGTGPCAAASERYKVFVYLAGDKCVGLCLAERIRHASKVVATTKLAADEDKDVPDYTRCSIRSETSMEPMLLGISRVWVSRAHRRKGIASSLLESARTNFFYGIEVPKKMVAFSQPTESGRQLAEDWFGEQVGWHVYAETD